MSQEAKVNFWKSELLGKGKHRIKRRTDVFLEQKTV
jgi:hypothetical protein